jgi:hypothetical protein
LKIGQASRLMVDMFEVVCNLDHFGVSSTGEHNDG